MLASSVVCRHQGLLDESYREQEDSGYIEKSHVWSVREVDELSKLQAQLAGMSDPQWRGQSLLKV